MQKAVTLLELIVVIIIIGILAAMALPMFGRTVENTRAKVAVAALQQIRTGERVYRVEENDYWPVGSTETNIATINDTLRLDLDQRPERDWDYSISAAASPADTFTATATRTRGSHATETIVFNQDGLDSGSSTWTLPIPVQ